jgi:hypothetical protein
MFSSNNSQVSSAANYIEDCFSTYLYTGNGSTQTITNGIDLSGKGGLVWLKYRTDGGANHIWTDTVRGATKSLYSNTTDAQATVTQHVTGFTTSGFSVGNNGNVNDSGGAFASWTFRKQPKFFDVVTWTGNGVAGRQISHSLGSVPACIIVKGMETTNNWPVYHQSLGNTKHLNLNTTDSQLTSDTWNNTSPTATEFTIGSLNNVNQNGYQFVAYLFAHNAGGFGLTGTDNVISCGSFTTDGSGNATVNLGYEPQWVLYKRTSSTGNWLIIDNMRGDSANATNNANYLLANTSDAEGTATWFYPTATGFTGNANSIASTDFIYIAIRRGPMKVPTSGTEVFLPKTRTGNGTAGTVVAGASWPMDMLWISRRTGGGAGVGGFTDIDRLRGAYLGGNNPLLRQNQTDAESTTYVAPGFVGGQTSYDLPSGGGYGLFNTNAVTYVDYLFRRSPTVFDEVCYTGNGAGSNAKTHNLTVAPELLIIKNRSAEGSGDWFTFHTFTSSNFKKQLLDATDAQTNYTYGSFLDAQPTSTTFTVNSGAGCNASGTTYVAYLFATCAGVSKVGSYTGTGTTKQVDCGFTAGARFVLIKRTDSTGDWYVWDTARGIVSGNDPYLLLNSTAAEVTTTDYIDPYSAGFEISSTAPSAINASGGTFIFLAIA